MRNNDDEDTPFICDCAGVYGYQVDESILEGNRTEKELSEDLRVLQGCGGCLKAIRMKLLFWEDFEG